MRTITKLLRVSLHNLYLTNQYSSHLLDNEIPVVKKEYLVACMEEEDKVDEAKYIAKLVTDSSMCHTQ